MQTVNIKRDVLLDILKKNRDEHRAIFLEAQKKYREEVITHLDRMLQDARDNKRIRTRVELIEPSDHTVEYERAIRMLELSTDDIIELTEHEFTAYVMDEWTWSRQWALSNAGYSTSAKVKKFTE